MFDFALYFVLCLSVIVCVICVEPDTVSSPLRVAQCRAVCLEKFSNNGASSETMCLQGPDCFMCWENCELLQSNFQVWGVMCKEKEICFPGCQEACRFHTETSTNKQQSQPVIHTKGETVIHVHDAQANWPRPVTSNSNTPLVYVVMRKSQSGPWRQIIQTIDLFTRVPINSNGVNSTLRVLAVDSQGLVTIYSPIDESNDSEHNKKQRKTINTEIKSIHDQNHTTTSSKWILHENSLIHQKILVIGELSWEPKSLHGLYLVTWEVDGGGLKGNLYTDTTCVTLSLWPDTLYHIQVELVSNTTPGVENIKTEMLDLDTSRAQIVSTESQELLTIVPSDDTYMMDSVSNSNSATENDYTSLSSYSVVSHYTTRSKEQIEFVAGCVTAVVLFVCVIFIIIVVHKRNSSKHNFIEECMDDRIRPCQTMSYPGQHVCRKGFQPIISTQTSKELNHPNNTLEYISENQQTHFNSRTIYSCDQIQV